MQYIARSTMRSWFVLFAIVIPMFLTPQIGEAKPMDTEAATEINRLSIFFAQPLAKRTLSEAQVNSLIAQASADNPDKQLVAVLGLAFAKDNRSGEVVKELSSAQNALIAGAAAYALEMRRLVGKEPAEIYAQLSKSLQASKDSYKTLFLANRLAVDFPKQSDNDLLAAAKREQNDTVKSDLLYYLSRSDDKAVLRQTLLLKWDNTTELSELLAFVLGSVTPQRSKDPMDTSPVVLRKLIQEKAN